MSVRASDRCDAERPWPPGNSHAPWWCRTHGSPIGVVADRCAEAIERDRAGSRPDEEGTDNG